MADDSKKAYSIREFKSIFPYIIPFIPHYIAGLICLILVDFGQILIPQFIKSAIDLLSSRDANLNSIGMICLQMLAISMVISLGRFLWRFFINGASRKI